MSQRYRVTIEESNFVYGTDKVEPGTASQEQWKTIDHIETTDKLTVAAALRGIATRYDPPKEEYRR